MGGDRPARYEPMPRAIYRRRPGWIQATPQADVLSVIALVDPARSATETDLAALEYAATALSVELARVQSVSEAERRGQADREREVAEARAAVLAVSEARQRAFSKPLSTRSSAWTSTPG